MGVLNCNRRGCENIMCDWYSSEYGYICNNCFDELISRGVHVDIEEFMDSRSSPVDTRAAENYWKTIFRNRDSET